MQQITKNLEHMAELSSLLDQALNDVEIYNEDYVRAKSAHKTAYAREFLSLSGSVEARRQQAILNTASEELTMDLAEVKWSACRERIRVLGTQIEVTRSINAALQKQWMAEPMGQYT